MRAEEEVAADDLMTLRFDEAMGILSVLNEVVVALDRMGSRAGGGEDMSEALDRYFTEQGATIRLSNARSIVAEAMLRTWSGEYTAQLLESDPQWPDGPFPTYPIEDEFGVNDL